MDFEIEFMEEDEAPQVSRSKCPNCERPLKVCWCSFLASPPILPKRTRIVLLQHPKECKRAIRTGLIVMRGMDPRACSLFVGTKFPGEYEELKRLLTSESQVYLLFPSGNGPLQELESLSDSALLQGSTLRTFIFLDGTWDEAKKMFARSPLLKDLPRIQLKMEGKSEYSVRTQPSDQCFSTLECVSRVVSVMERDPSLYNRLIMPMKAMCNAQINHGSVEHDSKESKKHFIKLNMK